jgi:hypothetical protein
VLPLKSELLRCYKSVRRRMSELLRSRHAEEAHALFSLLNNKARSHAALFALNELFRIASRAQRRRSVRTASPGHPRSFDFTLRPRASFAMYLYFIFQIRRYDRYIEYILLLFFQT